MEIPEPLGGHPSGTSGVTLLLRHEVEDPEAAIQEADLNSEQGFDNDDYLLNPEAYYKKLDQLERLVVETSEFYHCKGSYEPTITQFDLEDGSRSLHCRPNVWRCVERIAGCQTTTPVEPGETGDRTVCARLSLGKSYLIFCHVLDCLELITQKGFCEDS